MEKESRIVKYILSKNPSHCKVHRATCQHVFNIRDYNVIGFDDLKIADELYNAALISKPSACEICLDAKETEIIENIKRRKRHR